MYTKYFSFTKIFVSALAIVSAVISCAPDISDKTANEAITKLSSGPWKLTAETWRYNDGSIEDQAGPGDPCKDDDVIRYELNGDATFTPGPVPCAPFESSLNVKYAVWEIREGGTKLREIYTRDFFYDDAGAVVIYNILALTDTRLVLSRNMSVGNDPDKTVLATYTYTR